MAPISVTLAPRDPPAAVVALVGEHDAYSAGRLEGELAVLLDEGRNVVVDLTGLRSAFAIYETLDDALNGAGRGFSEGSSVRSAA
jgi:hypothetical protein